MTKVSFGDMHGANLAVLGSALGEWTTQISWVGDLQETAGEPRQELARQS